MTPLSSTEVSRIENAVTLVSNRIAKSSLWIAALLLACAAAPAWSQPCDALSLQQNGYAAAAGSLHPNFGWESFTVEAWIFPYLQGTQEGTAPTVVDMVVATDRTYTLAVRNDGFGGPSFVEATLYGLPDVLANTSPVVWGQWNHVAFVYQRFAFGDDHAGVLVNGSGTLSALPRRTTFPATAPFTVGAFKLSNVEPERFFWGYIDELSVSAQAKYLSNFVPPLTIQRDSSTRGLYHFDATGAKTFHSDADAPWALDLTASGHAAGGRAPVCGTGAPTIDSPPDNREICEGQTIPLYVDVTATGPPTYQWYRGPSGDTLNPIPGATENIYVATQANNYWVRIQNVFGYVDSPTATVVMDVCPPPTVETLAATNATKTTATLNAMVNANGNANYTIATFKYGLTTLYGSGIDGTPYYFSGTLPVPVTASISGLACGTTYHVRASATNFGGTAEAADLTFTSAACSGFTDDPLTPQSTMLKAVHLTELRARIDALRARFGLTAFAWTDSLLAGGLARAIHVQELRTALRAAYAAAIAAALPVTQPSFADDPLSAGTPIKALHIEQLRAAVLLLEAA